MTSSRYSTAARRGVAAIVSGLAASAVCGQTLNLAQTPLFLVNSVKPNVLVVYDNSQSMDGLGALQGDVLVARVAGHALLDEAGVHGAERQGGEHHRHQQHDDQREAAVGISTGVSSGACGWR